MDQQNDQNKSQNSNNSESSSSNKAGGKSTFKNQTPIEEPKDPQQPDEFEVNNNVKAATDRKEDNPYHELQMEDEMGVDSDVDVPNRRSPSSSPNERDEQRP